MNPATGKYLIISGILLTLAGLVLYTWGDKLNWIGRLPGDIRIEKDNFRFYFPITTMVIVSLVLTLLMQLLRRFR